MSQQLNADLLQKVLMSFEDKETGKIDTWTVEDSFKGIGVYGATGSGKTSASGRALAFKYLIANYGGLVLTVKPEETKLWLAYCNDKEVNRGGDVILFSNNSEHTEGKYKGQVKVFNPIDYELRRLGEGAGDTQNIINLFMNIYKMGNRIAQEGDISKEERFWDSALKRIIGKTVELLKLAKQPLSMANICLIMTSCCAYDEMGLTTSAAVVTECTLIAKGSRKNAKKYEDEIYFCANCIAMADVFLEIDKDTLPLNEYEHKMNIKEQVKAYFMRFLNLLDEKTKFTIIESFMGLAEPFTQGVLNRHFSGETNLFPEEAFEGKIIIIDFPVKKYLDVGIIAQCVFKLMFQQAVERRSIDKETLPVFLWADEAHMFINPYDQLFLTTARSAMCSTVYLTQSISNYYAVMGSGSDSKSKVDSLLGNLTTKIFHANADAETNEYASRLIGQAILFLNSKNISNQVFDVNPQTSQSQASQYLPQVQPREFTTLLTGGKDNEGIVEAVLFSMGKKWSSGKNYIHTSFEQNIQL